MAAFFNFDHNTVPSHCNWNISQYLFRKQRTLQRRHLLANSLHHCYLKRHLMIVLGVDWVGMQDAHCRGQNAM